MVLKARVLSHPCPQDTLSGNRRLAPGTMAAVLVALFQDRIKEKLLRAKLDIDILPGISIPWRFSRQAEVGWLTNTPCFQLITITLAFAVVEAGHYAG